MATAERVQRTSHKTSTPLAILFADIAGSTRLYERLGNTVAKKIVSDCLRLLSEVTERHSGRIVKSIGDELMCVFPNADDAAQASTEMHHVLRQAAAFGQLNMESPCVRVGFHFGPVIQERGDVFGDAVNVAARVVAQAKARQILTTFQTLEQMNQELRSSTRFIDHVSLKGKTEALDLYEVIWEEENLTVVGESSRQDHGDTLKLRVQFQGKEIDLGRARPMIGLGRGQENDIVVADTLVSRLHARIELRRDKFVLVDQSINGTFLHIDGEAELCLRRGDLPLRGSGLIRLGRSTHGEAGQCISFVLETVDVQGVPH
jgi:class 3 adenylate cyclase